MLALGNEQDRTGSYRQQTDPGPGQDERRAGQSRRLERDGAVSGRRETGEGQDGCGWRCGGPADRGRQTAVVIRPDPLSHLMTNTHHSLSGPAGNQSRVCCGQPPLRIAVPCPARHVSFKHPASLRFGRVPRHAVRPGLLQL